MRWGARALGYGDASFSRLALVWRGECDQRPPREAHFGPRPGRGRCEKASNRATIGICAGCANLWREEAVTEAIDAPTLKGWLSDGSEIALIDVREAGQFGQGHLFFAVPLPYSRFELGLNALVPNRAVRMVLCDGGQDAVAKRAAKR